MTDKPAPAHPADVEALLEGAALTEDQLKHDQAQLRKSHALLNKARIDSNGVGGYGKREELTLPQRIIVAITRLNDKDTEIGRLRALVNEDGYVRIAVFNDAMQVQRDYSEKINALQREVASYKELARLVGALPKYQNSRDIEVFSNNVLVCYAGWLREEADAVTRLLRWRQAHE